MAAKDYHLSPQTRAVSKLAKTPAVYKQAKITDPSWSLNKGDRGIDMILQEFEILCNKYDEILAWTKKEFNQHASLYQTREIKVRKDLNLYKREASPSRHKPGQQYARIVQKPMISTLVGGNKAGKVSTTVKYPMKLPLSLNERKEEHAPEETWAVSNASDAPSSLNGRRVTSDGHSTTMINDPVSIITSRHKSNMYDIIDDVFEEYYILCHEFETILLDNEMSQEDWEEEMRLIQEMENEWQYEMDKIIQSENDIILQTQDKILIQEKEDELFWEDHISQHMEDDHSKNENSRDIYYSSPYVESELLTSIKDYDYEEKYKDTTFYSSIYYPPCPSNEKTNFDDNHPVSTFFVTSNDNSTYDDENSTFEEDDPTPTYIRTVKAPSLPFTTNINYKDENCLKPIIQKATFDTDDPSYPKSYSKSDKGKSSKTPKGTKGAKGDKGSKLLNNKDKNVMFKDDDPSCRPSVAVQRTMTPLRCPSNFVAFCSSFDYCSSFDVNDPSSKPSDRQSSNVRCLSLTSGKLSNRHEGNNLYSTPVARRLSPETSAIIIADMTMNCSIATKDILNKDNLLTSNEVIQNIERHHWKKSNEHDDKMEQENVDLRDDIEQEPDKFNLLASSIARRLPSVVNHPPPVVHRLSLPSPPPSNDNANVIFEKDLENTTFEDDDPSYQNQPSHVDEKGNETLKMMIHLWCLYQHRTYHHMHYCITIAYALACATTTLNSSSLEPSPLIVDYHYHLHNNSH